MKRVWITMLACTAVAFAVSAFVDVVPNSGITFVLNNSESPDRHQIEPMVGGVAVFDFDNDGKLDLYFVNGARQPDLTKSDPSFYNRLYRNRGDGTFDDVTEKAGLKGSGFDVAVAAADYDNDGYTDLFVTGVRGNHLYHNRHDGTFEDVTAKARVIDPHWAVTAGWFDYDNDGKLDLFVSNYVMWDAKSDPFCGSSDRKIRDYCHPRYYKGLPNSLFHNNGDGTFTDVSKSSGIAEAIGKGMGIAFADYDGDGLTDIFVGNDTTPNFLFHNLGKGKFEEVALSAAVAYNDNGQTTSSMGADFRDVDNDGRPDIFYTALTNERFPLLRNMGGGVFADASGRSKTGAATARYSGWSTGIYDFNNDGWKDIFIACGDVQNDPEAYSPIRSKQENLLLMNDGKGVFKPEQIGLPAQHRGAAFGDLDGDGRVDIIATRIGMTPVIFHNDWGRDNHWIDFRLIGTKSNRDGLGAIVHITTAAGEQWNHATTAVGFASSSDKNVHFGLGSERIINTVDIRWPSGVKQRLTNVKADQALVVREP